MWPNPQFPADMVTFTEEILDGKLHFLCYETKKNLASGNAGEEKKLHPGCRKRNLINLIEFFR